MTIKIKNINQDEEDENRWMFQIFGPDTADGTVRIAVIDVVLASEDRPEDWLAANQATAQTAIDAGIVAQPFTAFQEAKNFAEENPNALQLVELAPDDLEAAIDNRTAGQETLLLKTLAYVARVWYAERKSSA